MPFSDSLCLTQSPRGLGSRQVCDTEHSNVQKKTLVTSPPEETQSLTLPALLAQVVQGIPNPTAVEAAYTAMDVCVAWCHVTRHLQDSSASFH